MTQNTKLVSYLSRNPGKNTISSAQALSMFKIKNLRARINDLRSMGHDIQTVQMSTRPGVRYFMST